MFYPEYETIFTLMCDVYKFNSPSWHDSWFLPFLMGNINMITKGNGVSIY